MIFITSVGGGEMACDAGSMSLWAVICALSRLRCRVRHHACDVIQHGANTTPPAIGVNHTVMPLLRPCATTTVAQVMAANIQVNSALSHATMSSARGMAAARSAGLTGRLNEPLGAIRDHGQPR